VKAKLLPGEAVLVLKVAQEQRGVVGIEGYHQSGIEVAAERVILDAGAAAGFAGWRLSKSRGAICRSDQQIH
jgi:hypothetical protein